MPELSIIIPNFNTKKLTHDCIASIYKHTKKINFEIILVDNASTDGSPVFLRKKFPKIKLIASKKNYGFGKACNIGVKRAQGDYVCVLNSDTLLTNDLFTKLIKKIKADKKIGVLAPSLVSLNNNLQYSGGNFPNLFNLFLWTFFIDDLPILKRYLPSYHLEDRGFYKEAKQFDWLQAACWIVKRDVFNKIGGFDEDIFMYGEDVDFSYRLAKEGYISILFPSANIVHLSQGAKSSQSIVGEYSSLKRFFLKYKNPKYYKVACFLLKLSAFNRFLLFGILGGNVKKKKVYLQVMEKSAQPEK